MFLVFEVLYAVVIGCGIACAWALRGRKRDVHPHPHPHPRSAQEDRLFERFARGEIGDDEYRHKRELLRNRLAPLAPEHTEPGATPNRHLTRDICPGARP